MVTIEERAEKILAALNPRCSCGHPADTGSRDHAPDCTWVQASDDAYDMAEQDSDAAEEEDDDTMYCEVCDEDITKSLNVGIVTGRWLSGSCARIERYTGLRAEKGRFAFSSMVTHQSLSCVTSRAWFDQLWTAGARFGFLIDYIPFPHSLDEALVLTDALMLPACTVRITNEATPVSLITMSTPTISGTSVPSRSATIRPCVVAWESGPTPPVASYGAARTKSRWPAGTVAAPSSTVIVSVPFTLVPASTSPSVGHVGATAMSVSYRIELTKLLSSKRIVAEPSARCTTAVSEVMAASNV